MIGGYVRFREVGGEVVAEAVVRLTVRGFAGQEVEIEAIIDTGFSGSLSLRQGDVILLGLPQSGRVETILADGSLRESDTYTASVVWDFGVERLTSIDSIDPEPLIGMGLLRGYNLSINVEDGGAVRITKLTAL